MKIATEGGVKKQTNKQTWFLKRQVIIASDEFHLLLVVLFDAADVVPLYLKGCA